MLKNSNKLIVAQRRHYDKRDMGYEFFMYIHFAKMSNDSCINPGLWHLLNFHEDLNGMILMAVILGKGALQFLFFFFYYFSFVFDKFHEKWMESNT